MQYTLTINQPKAIAWGLNAQQALLFAFVYGCPSWARPMERDGQVFYALSKQKIVEELPLLTDKPDTAYRMLRALQAAELIELSSTSSITLVRLTEKGAEWNRKKDGSEKYPRSENSPTTPRKKIRVTSENNPSKGRKNIRSGSENSPTNQDTSNPDTKDPDTRITIAQQAEASGANVQQSFEQSAPRCEIPADMPGPKDQDCKTFRTWANYAMAYRKRYSAWPVWNASVAGKLAKVIERLGQGDAPKVAAFFLTINDSKLINSYHGVGHLLANAEAYRTQWVTNRQMNSTTARQIEQTQANVNAAQEAADRIRGNEGKRNAFL